MHQTKPEQVEQESPSSNKSFEEEEDHKRHRTLIQLVICERKKEISLTRFRISISALHSGWSYSQFSSHLNNPVFETSFVTKTLLGRAEIPFLGHRACQGRQLSSRLMLLVLTWWYHMIPWYLMIPYMQNFWGLSTDRWDLPALGFEPATFQLAPLLTLSTDNWIQHPPASTHVWALSSSQCSGRPSGGCKSHSFGQRQAYSEPVHPKRLGPIALTGPLKTLIFKKILSV